MAAQPANAPSRGDTTYFAVADKSIGPPGFLRLEQGAPGAARAKEGARMAARSIIDAVDPTRGTRYGPPLLGRGLCRALRTFTLI